MNQRGFSTFVTVIIFGIIASGIAVTLLIMGLRANKTALAKEQYHAARAIAVACAEHALFALRIDFAYGDTITETVPTFTNGSCTIDVLGSGNTGRSINVVAHSTDNANTFRIRVVIDTVLPGTNLTSWEEVAS